VGLTNLVTHVSGVDERPETLHEVRLAHHFFNSWFLDPIYTGAYPTDFFAHLGLNPPPLQPGDMATIAAPLDFLGR